MPVCTYVCMCVEKLLTLNDIDEKNKSVKLHDGESHARIPPPTQHNIQKTMTLVKRPYVSMVVEI